MITLPCGVLHVLPMLTARTQGVTNDLRATKCTATSLLLLCSVLRNLAMLTARTELVMLGDLDMVIGADLMEVVSSGDK